MWHKLWSNCCGFERIEGFSRLVLKVDVAGCLKNCINCCLTTVIMPSSLSYDILMFMNCFMVLRVSKILVLDTCHMTKIYLKIKLCATKKA